MSSSNGRQDGLPRSFFRDKDLDQQVQLFEALLDYNPASLVFADTGRRIQLVNPAFEKMFGYSEDEALGRTTQFLYAHPEDFSQKTSKRFHKSARVNLEGYEMEYRRKDGSTFWAITVGSPVYAKDGTVLGMLGALVDISVERALREEVQAKEHMLKSVIETSFDGYWDWNIKDDYEFMSPRYWEILGFDPGEKKHHPSEWRALIFPEDLARLEENYKQHVATQGKHKYLQEVRFRAKDGRSVWILRRGRVVEWDGSGRPIRMVGSHTDLTQFKESQASIQRFKTRLSLALEASGIGIWEWDTLTGRLEWDDNMYQIFNMQPAEFSNDYEGWRRLVHPDDIEELERRFAEASQNQTKFDNAFRIIRPDGTMRYLRVFAHMVYENGEVVRTLGINWDITEAKEQEQRVIASREAALKANQAKSIFLSNMSHEIRTPMNGVLGFVELLRDTKLSEEQAWYVELIHNSTSSLVTLINDILDYSKIDAGRMEIHPEKVDLGRQIKELEQMFSVALSSKQVAFIIETSASSQGWFVLDSLRLRQILTNLIGNAVKFTEEGEVKLTVDYDAEQEQLLFALSDTGIGIREDRIDRIFTPFDQVDARVSNIYGGTGLGLSIVHRLVTLLGGSITCESVEGQGTRFRFFIKAPRSQPEEPKPKPKIVQTSRPDVGHLNVLLAEDNLVNQKLVGRVLERMGVSVTIVESGSAAVDACGQQAFDLIFMDINMPEMDGYEATRAIRDMDLADQPRIYALTANAFEEDRKKAMTEGMDGHVAKPFKRDHLEQLVYDLAAAKAKTH